ncbi:hypothetical protein CRG98_020648 [Punica granatum]|uniref:Uncharacterized protein n=1 Tax=Punica granatum TaxID=22663 RepID=A0A2I0JRJ4_PUNGR|nr:hypothetical protein CRG98_020648 [Punica granatum]
MTRRTRTRNSRTPAEVATPPRPIRFAENRPIQLPSWLREWMAGEAEPCRMVNERRKQQADDGEIRRSADQLNFVDVRSRERRFPEELH